MSLNEAKFSATPGFHIRDVSKMGGLTNRTGCMSQV